MPISPRPDARYLRVTCRRDFPSQPYREMRLTIRDEATLGRRVAHPGRRVRGRADAGSSIAFWFGSAVAEHFHGGEFKVALLVSSQRIDKLGENTAVNRGARLLVNGKERAALGWLMR